MSELQTDTGQKGAPAGTAAGALAGGANITKNPMPPLSHIPADLSTEASTPKYSLADTERLLAEKRKARHTPELDAYIVGLATLPTTQDVQNELDTISQALDGNRLTPAQKLYALDRQRAAEAELQSRLAVPTLEQAAGVKPELGQWQQALKLGIPTPEELAQIETQNRGLLDRYVGWACTRTSAPLEYHEAVFLAVLSTLTQRRLVMRFSHKSLYPNLWLILVGLSGVYKKSTAMGYGLEVLKVAAEDLHLSNDFSVEALISELAEHPAGLFYRDEFSSFLQSLKRDYQKGLKEMLAWLYDCPDRYKRKLQSGTCELESVYVVSLAATTPKRLVSLLEAEDWYSGFVARWCIVAPTRTPEYRDACYETPETSQEQREIAAVLAGIRRVFNDGVIEARFTPEALDRYNGYCRALQAELLSEGHAEELSATYARIEELAAKVSMLMELCRSTPQGHTMTVGLESLLSAMAWTEQLRQNARRLCAEFTGEEAEGDTARVLRMIQRGPGILWRKLLQNSHLSAGALGVILERLEHDGLITSEPEGKTKGFYPTTEAI